MPCLGARLVAESIDLNRQWMRVHKYLYGRGEEIIKDSRYNSSYQMYELEQEVVGHEASMPPIPSFAKLREEADAFGVPLWNHIEQFRQRKK